MVAMETMHFHIANTSLFRRTSFRIQRVQLNNFGMNLKGPRGIGEIVRQLLPWVDFPTFFKFSCTFMNMKLVGPLDKWTCQIVTLMILNMQQ